MSSNESNGTTDEPRDELEALTADLPVKDHKAIQQAEGETVESITLDAGAVNLHMEDSGRLEIDRIGNSLIPLWHDETNQ